MTKHIDLISRYQASGLSQKAFAKQEGISPSTISYHLNKNKKASESSESSIFSEVEIVASCDATNCIKIITPSGTEIQIPI